MRSDPREAARFVAHCQGFAGASTAASGERAMKKTPFFVTPIVLAALSAALIAQNRGFTPVTRADAAEPEPR